MCMACELGLLLALDDFPDGPPPGFPRAPTDEAARFACDAPTVEPAKSEAPPKADERKP
jgi:hypothetical protein